MPNNEKILSRKENFPSPFRHKPSATMITRMLGIEHFFFNQIVIHGFSIFMNNAQTPFQFGSTIGGQCLVAHQSFFYQKPRKAGITGLRLLQTWNHTYNFLDSLMLHASLVGNFVFNTFSQLLIHYH